MREALAGLLVPKREKIHELTRPEEASSSLTGHSRTEATKQYDAGS